MTGLVVALLHVVRFVVRVQYAPAQEWGVLLSALVGVALFGEAMRRCQASVAVAILCIALLFANVIIPSLASPTLPEEDEEDEAPF